MLKSEITRLGISRHLTAKYADIKKSCNSLKNQSFSDKKSSLNENGKTT